MCAVSAQEEQESVLARAYFRWSAEGWNATTKDGERVRLGHREISACPPSMHNHFLFREHCAFPATSPFSSPATSPFSFPRM
jgi:hypothetical protein